MFYDIKPLLWENPINIWYSLIVLIIALIGYLILFSKKQETTTFSKNNSFLSENLEKEVENLEKLLNQLSEIFYSKFNSIFKKIIQTYEKINLSNKTLLEVKNLNLPENVINLLELTYFKEYSNLPDNPQTRLKHIQQLKTILQNYKQKGLSQKNIG